VALACALKYMQELSNDYFVGCQKTHFSEKRVAQGALYKESEYVYSLFQKCWFEAYGHLSRGSSPRIIAKYTS